MKKISGLWTLVYKEKDEELPLAFSYTSEKDALEAKMMVEDSNGGELFDEHENVIGIIEIEWCYLLRGKLIAEK